jgi:peptidoglycan/LPS O-acetylase OafA/YrhL
MKSHPIYLHGLNGLRAIAALSVVIAHVSFKDLADFGLPSKLRLPMAGYGVTLFFVISGFLITYLLMRELEKTKTVRIKKFYARRILRIWPIYYLYIGIAFAILWWLNQSDAMKVQEMWYYIFFAANIPFIYQQGILILVHYWSIGVEEQFYLFWPWLVRFSKKNLLKTSALIFIIFFSIKIILWFTLGNKSYEYRFFTVTRFHIMMIGAIGSIFYIEKQSYFLLLFSSKITQFLSWTFFVLMGLNIIHIPKPIAHEAIAIASLSMIVGQIMVSKRIVNLENKLCDFIGKISYGIYVIHPIILLLLSKIYKNINVNIYLKYVLVYSTVVFATICFAWLSYTYFEKPFLKLKSRFAVVQSSNTMLSKN